MPRNRERQPGESTSQSGKRTRQQEIDLRIDMLLNPQLYKEGEAPSWETISDDRQPGSLFTVEELVRLRPFRMEDMKRTIGFRGDDKIWRACQRIKERSGGVYDIISDLYRDIFILGLIVMSQRYEDILGGEIIIEAASSRVRRVKEIFDQVRRLGEVIYQQDESDQNSSYLAFIEMVRRQPYKVQVHYVNAMETNPLLATLRRRLAEQAKREEESQEPRIKEIEE